MSRPRPHGQFFGSQNVNVGRAIVSSSAGGVRNRHKFLLGADADKNCALCAAAGVINLGMGQQVWTSGMVAEALCVTDDKNGMGDNLDVQTDSITKFCKPFSRSSQTSSIGSLKEPVTLLAAREFMSRFADGTVFAVYAAGEKQGRDKTSVNERGKAGERASHWLNAIKRDGQLQFIDFQSDHVERDNAATLSDTPILGITGQTIANPEMVVVAFSGTPAESSAASEVGSAAAAAVLQ